MNPFDTPISQLDDVLIRWHRWSASERYGVGYPSESPSCRMWRVSRQHDNRDELLDSLVESKLMQAVDHAIQHLDRLERMALSMDARNLATGCRVWSSPALPKGEELVTLMAEARIQLRVALEAAGLW